MKSASPDGDNIVSFDPQLWHVASERLFEATKAWLHSQQQQQQHEVDTGMSANRLLLVVDNFPLRSMRLRYRRLVEQWATAEQHSSSTNLEIQSSTRTIVRYGELYLLGEVEACVRRNAAREGFAVVPEQVLRSMDRAMETPLNRSRCRMAQQESQRVCLLQSTNEIGPDAIIVEALPTNNSLLLHVEHLFDQPGLWDALSDVLMKVLVCGGASEQQDYLALRQRPNVHLEEHHHKSVVALIDGCARHCITQLLSGVPTTSSSDFGGDPMERLRESLSAVPRPVLAKRCVAAKKALLEMARARPLMFLQDEETDALQQTNGEMGEWVVDRDVIAVTLVEILLLQKE